MYTLILLFWCRNFEKTGVEMIKSAFQPTNRSWAVDFMIESGRKKSADHSAQKNFEKKVRRGDQFWLRKCQNDQF